MSNHYTNFLGPVSYRAVSLAATLIHAATTPLELVAPAAGKVVRVLGYKLTADTTGQKYTMQANTASGTRTQGTDKTGAMPCAQTGNIGVDPTGLGVMETLAAEGVYLLAANTGGVAGHITYIQF